MPKAELRSHEQADTGHESGEGLRGPSPYGEVLSRLTAVLRRHFVEPLVHSNNPPWFDARGVAMGLLVGFGVPMGGQIAALVVLRAAARFNSVIAFAFSWVSNPVTILPMYYLYYYWGSLILKRPEILSRKDFMALMRPVLDAEHFWGSLQAFAYLGADVLVRWSVIALILGTISAVLGYVLGLHFQTMRWRRRAEKVGITYEKLLEDLEERIAKGEEQSSPE